MPIGVDKAGCLRIDYYTVGSPLPAVAAGSAQPRDKNDLQLDLRLVSIHRRQTWWQSVRLCLVNLGVDAKNQDCYGANRPFAPVFPAAEHAPAVRSEREYEYRTLAMRMCNYTDEYARLGIA